MNDYVDTAALRIAYDVSGPPDGRPVVAVHGWPDDIHCWDGVLPYLHRAGCRVHRPYLRGFGPTRFRSADRRRSGQIGALGRDLADFVEALDLHDVVVAGHDWGARAGYVVGALFPTGSARSSRSRRATRPTGPTARCRIRWPTPTGTSGTWPPPGGAGR
ncbi:Haloalkane dehalogenase [Streptomyces rimosus subsp. rimosus]